MKHEERTVQGPRHRGRSTIVDLSRIKELQKVRLRERVQEEIGYVAQELDLTPAEAWPLIMSTVRAAAIGAHGAFGPVQEVENG